MMTNLNKEESGRSMVEMLGVLAVIGVLSITGISGYTTAMNKHKANQILDAASKRAVAVSTQIQRGSTSPTLGEFDDNEVGGATFGTSVKNTAGTADFASGTDNRFTLTLSNVDSDICKQMQSIAGNDGILRDFHSDCSKLTYNNDLTSDAVAGDYKTQETCEATGAGKYWCTDHCVNSSADCGPSCPSFASTSNTGSYTGGSFVVTSGGESLTCYCPTGYKYNDTNKNCGDAITTTCTSWTRNECGAGKYCQFTPNSCTDGDTKIAPPSAGECKDITPCGMENVTGTSFRHSDYGDSCSPDWWTANAICAADGGRKLVSLENVGCKNSKNATCDSAILNSIRSGGFTYTFWTTDMYTEGDNNSCGAWSVNFYDFVDSSYFRNDDFSDVLCQ